MQIGESVTKSKPEKDYFFIKSNNYIPSNISKKKKIFFILDDFSIYPKIVFIYYNVEGSSLNLISYDKLFDNEKEIIKKIFQNEVKNFDKDNSININTVNSVCLKDVLDEYNISSNTLQLVRHNSRIALAEFKTYPIIPITPIEISNNCNIKNELGKMIFKFIDIMKNIDKFPKREYFNTLKTNVFIKPQDMELVYKFNDESLEKSKNISELKDIFTNIKNTFNHSSKNIIVKNEKVGRDYYNYVAIDDLFGSYFKTNNYIKTIKFGNLFNVDILKIANCDATLEFLNEIMIVEDIIDKFIADSKILLLKTL